MQRLEEIREYMPAVYLTLMSMLEAIALETLVEKAIGLSTAGASALEWSQAIVMLLTIVYVWVAYAQGVVAVRWVVGGVDAAFPFGVAILQFIGIEMIGSESTAWWFAAFGVGFLGGIGNYRRAYRLGEEDPKNAPVLARISLGEVLASLLVVAGVATGFAILAAVGWSGRGANTAGTLALATTIVGATGVWLRQWRRITAAA